MILDKEVASFAEADQFPRGKTQFACGFFGCYMAASMAPPGHPPALTPQQIIEKAETAYAQYDGDNSISNTDGMSLEQEYALLRQIGLHYQALPLDIQTIKAWVTAGYPVLIALAEVSVVDLMLGRNPYPWHAAGNHIILITGVTSDGNVLVRDSANCTNLYDPNSLRPGPCKYDAAKLQLVSATIVVPPWKPRPTSAAPPQEGDDMIDITNSWVTVYFTQTATSPERWHCAKTVFDLFAGILAGWRAMNGAPRLPLGPETKCGQQAVYQRCESGIIVYDPAHELDGPHGPWEPCYLLKFESTLAKQLLGQAPVDTTLIAQDINAIADAIATPIAKALADLKRL
jgi:hypothetical protein